MTSPDRSSGPAAGYLPDPLDVWSALESVYWSAQQSAHPWAEALAGLRDSYLGVQAAALVVAKVNDPVTPEDWEKDPRALVAYDLGRLVTGERAWPVRLTTALATDVGALPPDMTEVRGRWQARVFEFARRAQHALDCLAAGRVPTEVELEGVPLHMPTVRPPVTPAQFRGGPHGGMLASTETNIAHAEEAIEAVHEMTTDEDTGAAAAVVEWRLPEYEAAVDLSALWPEYLGEWATAAVYVLAVDHRAQLVELFVEHVTGGGRHDG
jgi:hypothetical protein